METEAIIWTEGKTDWKHLKQAYQKLRIRSRLGFHETEDDMGDDRLLKQCRALALVPQTQPNIFIFDRDNDEMISKVEDPAGRYKAWGNNVYSFAIPAPPHRLGQSGICIEFYYTDDELETPDGAGRHLFLSSEFNPTSGRSVNNSRLSTHKGKLPPIGKSGFVRIVDSEVFDEKPQECCLVESRVCEQCVGTERFICGF